MTYWWIWYVQTWDIAQREQRDKYGHGLDHPNCQLEVQDDYSTDIPKARSHVTMAMRFAATWHMSPDAVLDMPYKDFHERTLHHRALTLKRPWWTGEEGEYVYMYEKASGQRQPKPKS